ncbi:protein Mabiki [Drosophila biarmipes]|uniref:protein Mabiki n=1 Tax=Drosophila biarmipes TaxID=125945 RepID=UPI001CDB34E7|nr:protein Mabiki [Drosophila biarmipes]
MENTTSYAHKKFVVSKRKRDSDQDKENIDHQSEQPITKRRQNQGFFRPWLDNEQNQRPEEKAAPVDKPTVEVPGSSVSQYHANMVRRTQAQRQRSPKEQMRRDRNTLACLLSRRAKQAQEERMCQQYEQYRSHHAAMLEQQVRLSLYYRQILQQAVFQQAINPSPGHLLPQQQQQFLQQMALSQQMLIFGGQH